jgi:hypothetical protein
MQYSPWLQLKSMAGRMVGLLAARAPHRARVLRDRRPLAEPYPTFADTQPMCFDARHPDAGVTQHAASP